LSNQLSIYQADRKSTKTCLKRTITTSAYKNNLNFPLQTVDKSPIDMLYFFVNKHIKTTKKEKAMQLKSNRTFTMIKPKSVEHGHMGEIIDIIIKDGFKIVAMKMLRLSTADAQKFYNIHSAKPFFDDLVQSMTNGPIIVAVLEKDDAVNNYRRLIGCTNPKEAVEGTIRKKYGISISDNSVHGSDSDENAEVETYFYFSEREIC
jgi:nucleoside-diphosphate kinase